MTKVIKKEKISYLRPSSRSNLNVEDILYSNDFQNNNTSGNNDINTTLTNISNQLRNIAFIDKNKEQRFLNSSFRVTNRNKNLNSFFDNTNIDINQRFQNLQKKKVCDFFIAKNIQYENFNYDEIQKENLELKENIKFLLKQIKKYQKSGLTIEDMNVNREQKMENLEKELSQLKNELLNCKSQIMKLNNSNKELKEENKELKDYINKINKKELKERKNQIIEREIDLGENHFHKYSSSNNFIYKSKNMNLKQEKNENEEEENEQNSNSKLSDELLYEINKELLQERNIENKNKSYLSEGKLYCRKNIVKNSSFNYEPRNIKNQINKYKVNKKFTYLKNFQKNQTKN